MTSKHTPGPWRIGTPPPNGEQTIGDAMGMMVAVATTGPGVDTEANARLIAAAPDLLKACQSAEWDGLLPEFTCDKLRAAIAKATGGAD